MRKKMEQKFRSSFLFMGFSAISWEEESLSFDAVFVFESLEGITMDKLLMELELVATEVASLSRLYNV